jgi:hypothetical protein
MVHKFELIQQELEISHLEVFEVRLDFGLRFLGFKFLGFQFRVLGFGFRIPSLGFLISFGF